MAIIEAGRRNVNRQRDSRLPGGVDADEKMTYPEEAYGVAPACEGIGCEPGLAGHKGRDTMSDEQLNILCFGAHPDDCDLRFGGTAMKYRALGHRVRFVSMTNGDTGHFSEGGGPLARRRYAEAQAAAAVADIEYEVLDIHNGELQPSVWLRKLVIKIMREFKAHLVLCHRANDYHPDHRAVGTIVQDASYTVTVPNVAPLTPHLQRAPVLGYFYDTFELPNPYVPSIAIDTDEVFERKVDMIHCHASQMYEWLPYNGGTLEQVPETEVDRKSWLKERLLARFRKTADDAREALIRFYGEERGTAVQTAETVCLSEYGRPLPPEEIPVLFPFLPQPESRPAPPAAEKAESEPEPAQAERAATVEAEETADVPFRPLGVLS